MGEILLVKMALLALAMACIAFGGLTTRKGFTTVLDRRIDGSRQYRSAVLLGMQAMGLGAAVFAMGLGLFYILFILL
jgi:hypothetical protein